jgi:K+-transporting ATPase ATPase C chain
MLRELRTASLMLVVLTLVTGVAYPLVVTGVAGLVFPHQAGGSLVVVGGRVIGSEWLGQSFREPGHFWGRPSATGATPYDASASAASNLAISQQPWRNLVAARVEALRAADPGNAALVPADLVMASASGLDPDLSPEAADYQVARVARVRGLDPERVRRLVEGQVRPRVLGVLGEPRVNVLALNRELDASGVALHFVPGAPRGTLRFVPPGARP